MPGFKDLMVERSDMDECCMPVACGNKKMDYDLLPTTFCINNKQLPEVASWDLNKEYVFKVKLVGKRINEGKDEKEVDGTFEVVSAQIADSSVTPPPAE